MDLKGKKVSVVGLGARTGLALVEFLQKKGAEVFVSESRLSSPYLKKLSNIEWELGGHTAKVFQKKDLIVVSPGVPVDIPVLLKAQEKGVPVWSEIELASRFSKAPLIAVTGTNGKSTVVTLLGEYLKRLPGKTEVAGNIGIPLISKVSELGERDRIVVEVSSFQLELIENFKPSIATILNITPDHLNRHKTIENYVAAKKNIFKNQSQEDILMLNADDFWTRKIAQENINSKKLFFSLEKEVEGFFLKNNVLFNGLNGEGIMGVEEIKIPGRHNLGNVLVAAGLAHYLGVSKKDLAAITRDFRGLPHTLELVAEIEGIRFFNDSQGTNPGATISALQGIQGPKVLIGGGQDRNIDLQPLAETICKTEVKTVVLMGENRLKLREAVINKGFNHIYLVEDMGEAVAKAFELAEPGDNVLMSPGAASWDRYKDYKERGEDFRQQVRKLERSFKNGKPGS